MTDIKKALDTARKYGNVQAIKCTKDGSYEVIDTSGKKPKTVSKLGNDGFELFEALAEIMGLRVFHEVEDEKEEIIEEEED